MAAESQSWQANLVQEEGESTITNTNKMEITDDANEGVSKDFQAFIKHIFSSDRQEKNCSDFHVDKGVHLSEVLSRLSSVVPKHDGRICPPDTYNHICMLSQSVQGYMQLLKPEQLTETCEKIKNDTEKWLSTLFGLDSMSSTFHNNKLDGLLKVCKLALHSKYNKYATDGFTALYTRPPVVYISAAAPPEFGKQLRSELGLPQSSICIVPCNTMFGSPYTMDIAAFERLLTDDVSCGKTPLILIGYAGTPLSGHTDNLGRLREICTQSGVWFHIEGDTLANLTMAQVQPSIQVATSADSLTLNLSKWFGIPTLPYCTFYRTNSPVMAHSSGLGTNISEKLIVLPLWAIIQFMGTHDLKKIIEHASGLSQQMCNRLDIINGIKRIEQPTGVSPVVIFKYKASPSLPLSISSKDSEDITTKKAAPRGKLDISPKLVEVFNKLIVEDLESTVPNVILETVNMPREGTCLKFHPLQTSRSHSTSKNDVDEFVEQLQTKIVHMDYTLINRVSFQECFQRVPDVVLIDVSEEPAIGAFQCIPKYWKTKSMANLSDVKKHEANELNTNIHHGLSHHYKCLEQRTLPNGQVYIQVGIVDESFNLQQFADIVLKCTIDMEDNVKFVESLKDSVQKSIEEAQTKLEREREEKFFQDGVLRSVPLVSSLYNWWSPPPKENHGVTGRSFDLSSGKLETTEQTYKYKMQIHDDQTDSLSQVSQTSQKTEKDENTVAESVEEEHNEELSEHNSAGEESGSDVKESDV